MMLCLVGVLLSCGALCLTTPVPLPTPLPTKMGCTASYLILETLVDVQKLKSEVVPFSLCSVSDFLC